MWNREGRMQGHLDSPLTRAGVEQAQRVGRALGAHLAERTDHRMMVSPLGRCRQTAALICEEAGLDYASCEFDDDLKEIGWGAWEGHTFATIEARFPAEIARRRAQRWDHAPPGGESYAMLAARIGRFLRALPDKGTCVVVAHGGVGRVFRGVYAGLDPQDMIDLEQPQDAFYLLEGGEIKKIEAGD
jgi:broad specificity phosphatase PhoE